MTTLHLYRGQPAYSKIGLDLMYTDRDWSDEELPDYVELCSWCGGKGRYIQTYTAGCGLGHYNSKGPCDKCDGVGLIYICDRPVPITVIRQILVARAAQTRQALKDTQP